MNLFLKRIFLYSGIFILVYVISLNIIEETFSGPFKPNILYQAGDNLVSKKISESDTIKNVDILFVGSSHAYDSFNPKIFEKYGYTAFNWGTSQQSHPQTSMILDKYLKKLKPRLVVYEVFPEIFNATGRESMADFLNAGKPFEVGFFDLFQYENSIALFNTYLIKKSRAIFGLENNDENLLDPDVFYYKGYVEKRGFNNNKEKIQSVKWVPRKSQLRTFEENLTLLKDLEIPVVLVIAPYSFEYSNQHEIIEYLASKGKLFNYNTILKFDANKHFSDFHHMNYLGVKKMNEHFVLELKELERKGFFR